MELAKLAEVVRNYKNKFDIRWPEEKYKWQNIKQFQDNWDIDAENFVEMLENAIPATNLLMARNFFPRGMIIAFANNDPEKVRSMFRNLYNEQLDLKERITDFIKKSEEIRVKYGADEWGNHYQTENVVSIYLWLKFPDKYYANISRYNATYLLSVAILFLVLSNYTSFSSRLIAAMSIVVCIGYVVGKYIFLPHGAHRPTASKSSARHANGTANHAPAGAADAYR